MKISEKNVDFFKVVYAIVREIPKGKVTNYGAIAKALGSSKSSRMVGWAMNAAHNDPTIPAHRVVNRKGLLTGKMHFSTPNQMQELLETEGHTIKNDQIINFETVFWDPQTLIP